MGGCFERNTSHVQALGWLEKKEERRKKKKEEDEQFQVSTVSGWPP